MRAIVKLRIETVSKTIVCELVSVRCRTIATMQEHRKLVTTLKAQWIPQRSTGLRKDSLMELMFVLWFAMKSGGAWQPGPQFTSSVACEDARANFIAAAKDHWFECRPKQICQGDCPTPAVRKSRAFSVPSARPPFGVARGDLSHALPRADRASGYSSRATDSLVHKAPSVCS
jgi:hypothetical protein